MLSVPDIVYHRLQLIHVLDFGNAVGIGDLTRFLYLQFRVHLICLVHLICVLTLVDLVLLLLVGNGILFLQFLPEFFKIRYLFVRLLNLLFSLFEHVLMNLLHRAGANWIHTCLPKLRCDLPQSLQSICYETISLQAKNITSHFSQLIKQLSFCLSFHFLFLTGP